MKCDAAGSDYKGAHFGRCRMRIEDNAVTLPALGICFVLDFQNNAEAITFAFQDYYRTTLLAEETDPNKLHDLKAALDGAQVYSPEQVQNIIELFLAGADRDKLDPILDACVAVYVSTLGRL
jgi:type I site-specific restriction-modification system R (restriction) subunit